VTSRRLVVLAPNWLGDAVMALPALAELRAHAAADHLAVAARPSVAALFDMVEGIDEVVRLPAGRAWRPSPVQREAAALASARADLAILLTNSFRTAWVARRAGVPERWGVRADLRSRLLTRAVPRPRNRGGHHADYYRAVVSALGVNEPEAAPLRVVPPARAVDAAGASLAGHGVPPQVPLVGMAPGAAYGRAKQWPPRRFAELIREVHERYGATTVLVGSGHDRGAGEEIARCLRESSAAPPLADLIGATDLPLLAGVMTRLRAFVSNDSGAMHLAAAIGLPVAALFGSTDERATAPLPLGRHLAPAHAILTAPAWCRPCLLRECPIDHRCMTRIEAARVALAMEGWFGR
jgi:heptosyltransferase-2